MDYEFQISPYNDPSFVQQISCALEKEPNLSQEKNTKRCEKQAQTLVYIYKKFP